MDATPISFDSATPLVAGMPLGDGSPDAIARKWAALDEAAAVVAGLAGVPVDLTGDFALVLDGAPPSRRELARQGIEDLAAMMEPGLCALIAVHGHGGDTTAPALALWQEFAAARDALLAFVLPRD
jgi:hypothetical protein